MAETVAKEKKEERVPEVVKFVCPFNVRPLGPQDEHNGPLVKVPRISDQVKVDKETLKVSPVIDMVDLDAEIQTYKDMCGLEYFKLMLAQGKVTPESVHDDGAHSVDMSQVPETIHDASKIADAQNVVIAEFAKQLGIKDGEPVSQEKLIELLSQKVAANIAAKKAADGEGDK